MSGRQPERMATSMLPLFYLRGITPQFARFVRASTPPMGARLGARLRVHRGDISPRHTPAHPHGRRRLHLSLTAASMLLWTGMCVMLFSWRRKGDEEVKMAAAEAQRAAAEAERAAAEAERAAAEAVRAAEAALGLVSKWEIAEDVAKQVERTLGQVVTRNTPNVVDRSVDRLTEQQVMERRTAAQARVDAHDEERKAARAAEQVAALAARAERHAAQAEHHAAAAKAKARGRTAQLAGAATQAAERARQAAENAKRSAETTQKRAEEAANVMRARDMKSYAEQVEDAAGESEQEAGVAEQEAKNAEVAAQTVVEAENE